MTIVDRALPYVRAISPYQPGKPIAELAREMGIAEADIIKLASNENPLGMSPKAKVAAAAAMNDLHIYPDGNGFLLKQALSERYGVGADQVVLGNGSNDVLELIGKVFLAPGAAAVFSKHAFAVYPLVTLATGATCIEVPAKDYGNDLDAMLAAITPQTRMVFIANPNNPTGTFLPGAAIHAFLKKVPAEVVVVLDEAYNEYLPPALRADSVAWLKEFPNLVITRTFSKIYGLAGLRVGFSLSSPVLADLMNRVRQPFNVNNIALAAAVAALGDDDFVAASYESNRRGAEQIVAGLDKLGLSYIPVHGNFVTFKVGDVPTAGGEVNGKLLKQGVIVRPIAGYGMPEWLRVTIGTEQENARFLEALAKSL